MFAGMSKLKEPRMLYPLKGRITVGSIEATAAIPGMTTGPKRRHPRVGIQKKCALLLMGILKMNLTADHGGIKPCVG